jgi:iron(III) transport system ATP-binding protein
VTSQTEQAPAVQLAIRARGLVKRYGDSVALDEFSLDVWSGGILTLVGPSGCGKTTSLRVIAGFEAPERGTVEIRGRQVVGPDTMLPPERRKVGMVFQDYALFPHMSVAKNVAYGVAADSDRRRRVRDSIELVGLAGLEDRLPSELSGGQQQRVALARALAPNPDVILLDEPFSNLDASLRERVRRDLRDILQEANATAVFVTHDQEEALAMSDMVAVMRNGRVVQASTPRELYTSPADAWIAGFLGDADFIPGHAHQGRVDTPVGTFATPHDGKVVVMIRPEDISVIPDPDGDAVVVDREFFGHDQLITVCLPGGTLLRARSGPGTEVSPAQRVWVKVGSAVTFPS